VKLQGKPIRFEASSQPKPMVLTASDNTKRYPVVVQDFTNASDVCESKLGDNTPESSNGDSVVGEDEP